MKHSTQDLHLLPSPLATAQGAYAALPVETRDKLVEWIKTTIAPAKKVYDLNSYSIKHDAEAAIGIYISNDQFKGAMPAATHRYRGAYTKSTGIFASNPSFRGLSFRLLASAA
jgi:hypothetical protein